MLYMYFNFNPSYVIAAWGQQNVVVLRQLRKKQFPSQNLKLANAIYVIPCGTCNKVYIGETVRQVFVRVKEHQAYVKKKELNSSKTAVNKFA